MKKKMPQKSGTCVIWLPVTLQNSSWWAWYEKRDRKILVQDLGIRKLAVKLMPHNLEEQKDRHLCTRTMWNIFKKLIFWIVSWLVMKRGVISMIPRPNTNPWSGHQRIPPCPRSHGCQSPWLNGDPLFLTSGLSSTLNLYPKGPHC
jgi:hypothetical protein